MHARPIPRGAAVPRSAHDGDPRRPARTSPAPPPSGPDTIVLVHGFWVTPRSWEDWKAHYEAKGYRVLTPAYPGFEVEVEALNADSTVIAELTLPKIMEHLEAVVGALEKPPIIIGHSAGGTLTQLLLDRGYGAVGVVLNSAPTEGVRVLPLSQLKSTFTAFKNPANRHRAVPLTYEQWHYAFTNTFTEEESRSALRAVRDPGVRPDPLGLGAGQLHARTAGRRRRLQERGAAAAAVHLRQRGPHHAAERAAVERQALHVRACSPSTRSTRATPTCCPRRRAGRRSPTTRSSGP